MKRQLAIDCDNTVVFMDWISWQHAQDEMYQYDPLDYWRSSTLYDNLEPTKGAVDAIKELSLHFDIVFVSRLKGGHHRSKVYFLKKWFPFMKGFVGTHEKWLLADSFCALIDDDWNNLDKFPKEKRVLFGSYHEEAMHCMYFWDKIQVQRLCELFL